LFSYRQSAKCWSADGFRDQLRTPGIVTEDDPPTTVSDMVNLQLDPEGRLRYLQAIPRQQEEKPRSPQPVDWNVLFTAAGLDISQFQTTDPLWTSLADSDVRAAWTGRWPGTDRPLRVEAAGLEGKPVFFSLIGPWTKPERQHSDDTSRTRQFSQAIQIVFFLSIFFGALLLARRNYRRGKSDVSGAIRLASVVFALLFLVYLCRSHFMLESEALGAFIIFVSTALFVSSVAYLLYMVLEPYVRSRSPKMIISWNRLLLGQYRDPLVGRDILYGVMLGLLWCLMIQVRQVYLARLGAPPLTASLGALLSLRDGLGQMFGTIANSIQSTLVFFFVALLLRTVLRRDLLAGIVFTGLWATLNILQDTSYLQIAIPTEIVIYGVAAIVVFRFGLVALATGIFSANLLVNVPVTLDFSSWYATTAMIPHVLIAALSIWAFYLALAGRPLFKAGLLD